MSKFVLLTVAICAAFLQVSEAFAPVSSVGSKSSALNALKKNEIPTFDKKTNRWVEPAVMEEGYDKVGSLLRFGPKPYFTRLFNEDTYEQAVLKFMANEKVGRLEAQGNMDAFFENAQDWAYQKMVERRGGFKRDYVTLDKQQIVLSAIWGVSVTTILAAIFYDVASGNYCLNQPNANFCQVFGPK